MADIDSIRRRWSTDGGMGNERSADDYTDAGCRILAQQAFRDVNELLAVVAAVQDVVRRKRQISPSASMWCYIAEIERALGMDAPRPHKLGQRDQVAVETGE